MSGTANSKPEIELSGTERTALEAIARSSPPFSQRARTLLAVADGFDLATAGTGAGLSENQARYWLGRFRNGRLAIFPEELLPAAESAHTPDAEPAMLAAPPESPMLQGPPKLAELVEGYPETANIIALPATTAAVAAAAGKGSKKKTKVKSGDKSGKNSKKAKKSSKKGKDKMSKNGKKNKKNDKSKKDKKGDKGKKDKKGDKKK